MNDNKPNTPPADEYNDVGNAYDRSVDLVRVLCADANPTLDMDSPTYGRASVLLALSAHRIACALEELAADADVDPEALAAVARGFERGAG